MTTDAAAGLGRLRWRCRRGMRELDELLLRYVDERYAAASAAEKFAFERLLETQDTVIYEYCLGRIRPPSAEVAALIERITSRT